VRRNQTFFALKWTKEHFGSFSPRVEQSFGKLKELLRQLSEEVKAVTKQKVRDCYGGSFSFNAAVDGVCASSLLLSAVKDWTTRWRSKTKGGYVVRGTSDLQDFYRFFALHPVSWPLLACVAS